MRRIAIILFSIIWIIWIDISSKWYFESDNWINFIKPICSYVSECRFQYFPILSDLIGLQLSFNTWIAFSLPIRGLILQVITVIVIIWIVYNYIRVEYSKRSKLLDIGYVLIFGWAMSHAYERIFFWYVVDFIAVKYFAILNFADIFISIGALCLCYYHFFYDKK